MHCIAPVLAHAFHRALNSGDSELVDVLLRGFYLPLVALRDETPGFAVSLVKAGARLRGEKVGSVRPPLVGPDRRAGRATGADHRGRPEGSRCQEKAQSEAGQR